MITVLKTLDTGPISHLVYGIIAQPFSAYYRALNQHHNALSFFAIYFLAIRRKNIRRLSVLPQREHLSRCSAVARQKSNHQRRRLYAQNSTQPFHSRNRQGSSSMKRKRRKVPPITKGTSLQWSWIPLKNR